MESLYCSEFVVGVRSATNPIWGRTSTDGQKVETHEIVHLQISYKRRYHLLVEQFTTKLDKYNGYNSTRLEMLLRLITLYKAGTYGLRMYTY